MATEPTRFADIEPGTYTIRQDNAAGFTSTTPDEVSVSISSGGSGTANFGDLVESTVTGTVFEDLNGDGTQDADERGIGLVTLTLTDAAGTEKTATTIANGSYVFTDVIAGPYTIAETNPDGFVSTTPDEVPVTIVSDGSATVKFGDIAVGTVSGKVFEDLNGNGIRETRERGLGGVTVNLSDADGREIESRTTAGDGSYSFAGVTSGSYTVAETVPDGFAETTPGEVSLMITGDSSSAAVSFGVITQGTISGTVFEDLNGNGAQDAGEPGIGWVTLELTPAAGGETTGTMTMGDGSYAFVDLTAGNYTLEETDPDGFSSTTPNMRLISIADRKGATMVFGDLKEGTVSGTVFEDRNGNGTRDAGERGIGGVIVSLTDEGGSTRENTTTSDGSYAFTGVDPGDYTLKKEDVDGFVSITPDEVTLGMVSSGSKTVNFGNMAKGTVSGSVFEDENGNAVQDAGEPGIGGVTVELTYPNGTVREQITTSDGSYMFSDAGAGEHTVRKTNPDGFMSLTPDEVTAILDVGGSSSVSFGILAKGKVSGTIFEDRNGNGFRDDGERGLGGVTVTLISAAGEETVQTSMSDGSYAFTGVGTGAYTVRETDSDGFASTTPNEVSVTMTGSSSSATVTFGDIPKGTVSGMVFEDLNGNGDQDAGEPGIGWVTVELIRADGESESGMTMSDGSYAFAGVVSGIYTVRETDPEGFVSTTPNEVIVRMADDGAATAVFGDLTEGSVSGAVFEDDNGNRVRDPGERGIGGVEVTLTDAAGTMRKQTTTPDGSYIFTNVDPGDYTVGKEAVGGFTDSTPSEVTVTMVSGDSETVNFGNMTEGAISGTVFDDLNGNGIRDPGERGIGGVDVELLAGDGTSRGTVTTASDGSYTFADVDPGDYTVRKKGDPDGFVGVTPDERPVTLKSGGATTAGFGVLAAGKVTGTVFDDLNGNGVRDPGEPGIGGVDVTLGSDTETTGMDGSYSFAGVKKGDYTVSVADLDGYVNTTPAEATITIAEGGSGTASFGYGAESEVIVKTGIGDYVWYDTDQDGVRDAAEPGVAGVRIRLIELAYGTEEVIADTVTDGSGFYEFAGLLPGDYVVEFAKPSQNYVFSLKNAWNGSSELGDVFDSDASASTGRTDTISLGPDEYNGDTDAGMSIPDTEPACISGLIWYDTDQDGIQDDAEPGIAGVTVNLTDPGTGRVIATSCTDGRGRYEFTGLESGDYVVTYILPSGYDSNSGDWDTITLAPGDAWTGDAGMLIPDTEPASVGGLTWYDANRNGIRDAGEPGVAGVRANLYDITATELLSTTFTDMNGYYEFSGLSSDDYLVEFELPPGYSFVTRNQGNDALDSDASSLNGRTHVVRPEAGDSVSAYGGLYAEKLIVQSGRVWFDENKDGSFSDDESLPDVTVTLYDGKGHFLRDTETDANGNYAFANLPPGDYRVEVDTGDSDLYADAVPYPGSDGELNSVTDFTDQDSDVGNADFAYRTRLVTIGDRVWNDTNRNGIQDADETGISDVEVKLMEDPMAIILDDVEMPLLGTVTTDVDGFYEFVDWEPGNYRVQFVLPAGYQFTSQDQVKDDTMDSDADASGQTGMLRLPIGGDDMTVDAGMFISEIDPEGIYHDADFMPRNYEISLSEVLRMVQFYSGTDYHCDAGGEDGYGPGEGDHSSCMQHSADYNPPDWKISLSELLRVIQLYNVDVYHPDADEEDGFAPGP
jgi:uncharacterized protein (DUF2141 family)